MKLSSFIFNPTLPATQQSVVLLCHRHLPPCPALRQISETARSTDPGKLAFLEGIGLSPEEADIVLATAQRRKQTPLTDMVAASECLLEIGIPIQQLGEVISEQPELLTYTKEQLLEQYRSLKSAWTVDQSLRAAIVEYPSMLLPLVFNSKLLQTMDKLSGLGLNSQQVSMMVVKRPKLTEFSSFELAKALKNTNLDLRKPYSKLILTQRPDCLSPEGAEKLKRLIAICAKFDIQKETTLIALSKNPSMLDKRIKRLQRILQLLTDYGLNKDQLNDMILGYPQFISKGPERIQQLLGLLQAFSISPERLAAYPRVFTHNIVSVIGPRLAYLRQYYRKDLEILALVTIFGRNDLEFVARRKPARSIDDYENFQTRWISKYGKDFL